MKCESEWLLYGMTAGNNVMDGPEWMKVIGGWKSNKQGVCAVMEEWVMGIEKKR